MQPGIITMRRQPPAVCRPRRPLPRPPPPPDRINPHSWEQMVRAAHKRWDANTGAKVRAAEEVVVHGRADALDDFVRLQKERQQRLAPHRLPPVVNRLLAPPVPAPVLGPLDQFYEFVQANEAAGAAASHAHPKPVRRPERQPLGIATRTGLYYAV